jgi:hypothetical protein
MIRKVSYLEPAADGSWTVRITVTGIGHKAGADEVYRWHDGADETFLADYGVEAYTIRPSMLYVYGLRLRRHVDVAGDVWRVE